MSLQAVQNIVSQPTTTSSSSKNKDKSQSKYQERLPWESKHISPYIPKLDKIGFKNDYYIPDANNYEITKSFKPFLDNQIHPVREINENYSEYIKNLDEEEQARYTMDKFREFLISTSQPELSTESGLMNKKYRNKLVDVLDQYKKGSLSLKQSQNNQSQPQNPDNHPFYNSSQDKNGQQFSNKYNSDNKNAQIQQSINNNALNNQTFANFLQNGSSNKGENFKQQQQQQQFQQAYSSNVNPQFPNQNKQQQQQQQLQQQYPQQQLQQLKYQSTDIFNKELCFDYEKILLSEGRLKRGQDGVSWNNISEQYRQRLQEWSSDNDKWIEEQLLRNKEISTPYYLQPRVFRQVRPIDKIKKEVIKTQDGMLVPYESVVDRRSIEIMHQRDYLVQPSFVLNYNGEYELINDIFSFDRSFIIEQNPLTKTEILHEYPIHLTEDQLLDFLFQTGIQVNQIQQYYNQPQTLLGNQQNMQINDPQGFYQFQSQFQPQTTSIIKKNNNDKQSNDKKKKVSLQDCAPFDYDQHKRKEILNYFQIDSSTKGVVKQNKTPIQKQTSFEYGSYILPNQKDSQISLEPDY